MLRQISKIRYCARKKTACGHLKMYELRSMKKSGEQIQVSNIMIVDVESLKEPRSDVPIKYLDSIKSAHNQWPIEEFGEADEVSEPIIVDDEEPVENTMSDVLEKKWRPGEPLENARPIERSRTSWYLPPEEPEPVTEFVDFGSDSD